MGTYPPQSRTLPDGTLITLRSGEESDAAGFLAFHHHTSSTSAYVATSPQEITDTVADRAKIVAACRDKPTELLLLALPPAGTPESAAPGDMIAACGLRSPRQAQTQPLRRTGHGASPRPGAARASVESS